MTEQEFEAAWLDVCAELRMSMDGVYFEAAVMLAKKAEAAEREACAKLCEKAPCVRYDAGTAEFRAWNESTIDMAALILERSNVKLRGAEQASLAERPARTQGSASPSCGD